MPKIELPDVSEALREWRLKRDMTQRDAATVFGVSKRTYEGWEYGRLGLAHAKLMAAYLSLSEKYAKLETKAARTNVAA